jgi:hypothetical protein
MNVVVAIWASAALLAAPTQKECTANAEKGLIELPSSPLEESRFAITLHKICDKLLSAASAVFPSDTSGLIPLSAPPEAFGRLSRGTQPQKELLAKSLVPLRDACGRLAPKSGSTALQSQDVQVLWQVFENPVTFQLLEATLQEKATDLASFISAPSPGELSFAGSTTVDPLGNLQSQLINGLTIFVINRAKAEAQLYLTERLKVTLCSDEARPFFRNTCAAFEGIDARMQLAAMAMYLNPPYSPAA